jgi:hypothetical protein
MKMPDMLLYTRVDVVIECYDISKETQKELLEKMPDAYGGDGPGEDDWPEPDHPRDKPYLIKNIWAKLSEPTQADITAAVKKEERN